MRTFCSKTEWKIALNLIGGVLGFDNNPIPPSEKSNTYTNEDLKIMQGWSLERKIQVTQTRILEWFQNWDGMVYVSFSGGKDSTVLADLAARICTVTGDKLVLWFSNTGLEYPEVVAHVKYFAEWLRKKYHIEVELIIDYPRDKKTGKRITFKDVILKYGYPVVSKEISQVIEEARRNATTGKYTYRLKRLNGELLDKNGNKSQYSCEKWKFLLDAPYKISNKCCNELKKKPSKAFEKQSGRKPIIGTMAEESQARKTAWKIHGCNAFDGKRPTSQPMSFWKEQDILEYICRYNIPYPTVYGEIIKNKDDKLATTGCSRTGCMFCAYGCHLEKEPNRFQQLKETHPKIWEYCMKPVADGGLGMREVLEYIGIKTGQEQ